MSAAMPLGLDPIVVAREEALLAPYATRSVDSRGRKHAEPVHAYRSPFQRDRDRIVHCSAFRRMAGKTQVFTGEMGDYHRNRLTHTLEVASIARTIGRALRLNEDLIEALALMHDIGHPPFGHSGEDVLNDCLRDHGGFNHNGQALRIVELLEERYPDFPGLNLSLEVLAGQATRDKRRGKQNPQSAGIDGKAILEVQVVDAADSIAYDSHDVDDALQLGLLHMEDLVQVPLWRESAERVRSRGRDLGAAELRRAVVRDLIERLVDDVIESTRQRLNDAAQDAGPVVGASDGVWRQKSELEAFLFREVYRHPLLVEKRAAAGASLESLFGGYVAEPGRLPEPWGARVEGEGVHRAVGDFLASLTDSEATRLAAEPPE